MPLCPVAVTDLEYDKARACFAAAARRGMECLRAPAEENALADFIRDRKARHAIVGTVVYRGPIYEALPRGAALVRFGVGHDGIDKALARQKGILCANTPGTLDDSVAEHAMGLILAAMRHIPALSASVRAGRWEPLMLHELAGKRLAVVGCGAIGCRLARLAVRGFGMRVRGCKATPERSDAIREAYGFETVCTDFAQAVADADFVSLHIPSTPATRHYVGARRLAEIPERAWLVNTARGAVVDEAALYEALAAGRLGGAALDVFEHEPYRPVAPDRDLRTLDNAIMTPHVSSATHEACERVAARALEIVAQVESGDLSGLPILNGPASDAEGVEGARG